MVSKLMPGVRGPQQSQEVCTGSPSVTGGVDGVPISHRRCMSEAQPSALQSCVVRPWNHLEVGGFRIDVTRGRWKDAVNSGDVQVGRRSNGE